MPSTKTRRSRWWRVGLPCFVVALAIAALVAHQLVGERDRGAEDVVQRAGKLLDEGHPEQAYQLIHRMTPDGPEAAGVLAVRGMVSASLGQPEISRRDLERSLELRPDQPIVMKYLAAIYLSGSEMGRGLEMLKSAAKLEPKDFRPWFGMGGVYYRGGDLAAAVDAYREALKRHPGDVEIEVRLVTALIATGIGDDEVDSLLESLRKDRPNDPVILGLDASLAALRGADEQALRLANRSLKLDPFQRDILLLRSNLASLLGQLEVALHDAERVVKLDPTDLAGYVALTRAESMMGLKERAADTIELQRKARYHRKRMSLLALEVQSRPKDPEPRWQLGQVAAEAGSKTLAIQSYRAALALDPRCEPALRGLANLERPAHALTRPPAVP